VSGSEHIVPERKNDALLRPPASHLVAIVLSAAGLQPLREVLSVLPASFPAAVVVLQHVSDRSELPLVLAMNTAMPVKFAETAEVLREGIVYVCPPGRHTIVNPTRAFVLSTAPAVRLVRPSGDWLLESVAASFGDCALAVILSGRLSDGARGSRWISRAGGQVIAQHPETCGFASMPNAAIATGCANLVLPPGAIGPALQLQIERWRAVNPLATWEEPFALS
jgi:two-component system chemotaxis response regulator CheB